MSDDVTTGGTEAEPAGRDALGDYLDLIERERDSRPAEAMLADEITRLRTELWELSWHVMQETEGHTFGTRDYDMTLDDLHDWAASSFYAVMPPPRCPHGYPIIEGERFDCDDPDCPNPPHYTADADRTSCPTCGSTNPVNRLLMRHGQGRCQDAWHGGRDV